MTKVVVVGLGYVGLPLAMRRGRRRPQRHRL
jgi:UDP-N-acetyl-D-mannosaminuronate dehydrogenase